MRKDKGDRKNEYDKQSKEPHEENKGFYRKFESGKKTLTHEQREELRKANVNRRFKSPYAKKTHWWVPGWNPSKLMEVRIGRVLAAFGIVFEEPASIGAALALSDKARNDCARDWEEMHNATFTALSETNEMSVTACISTKNVLAVCDREERESEKNNEGHPWTARFEITFEGIITSVFNAQMQTMNLESEHNGVESKSGANHVGGEEESGYNVSFAYPVPMNIPITQKSESKYSSEAVQMCGIDGNANTQTKTSGARIRNGGQNADVCQTANVSTNLSANVVPEATEATEGGSSSATLHNASGSNNYIVPGQINDATQATNTGSSTLRVSQSLVASQNPVAVQINQAPIEQIETIEFSVQSQASGSETNTSQSAVQQMQTIPNQNPQAQTEISSSSGPIVQTTDNPIFQIMEFVEEISIQTVSALSTDSNLSAGSTTPITSSNVEFVPQTQIASTTQITLAPTVDTTQIIGTTQDPQPQEEPTSQGNESARTVNETAAISPSSNISQATYGAYSVIADQTPTSRNSSGKHEGGIYFSSAPGKPNQMRMSTPISPDPEKPENG
ncbi:TPA: hypothetical protein HA238_04155 [Candidatus Micrarchaeota archaeon]|nr:hypothetical protein [Candidatus Micrarchaeota archaeon]